MKIFEIKKTAFVSVFLLFCSLFSFAGETATDSKAESERPAKFSLSYELSLISKNESGNVSEGLADVVHAMGIDKDYEVPADRVRAVQLVLNHTYENRIHCMRGEDENQVYVNKDGREAVYDKDGKLVENPWNKGSFNFGNYNNGINKFLVDIYPWLIWGNAKDDPTTVEERLYYYLEDLLHSSQVYLFESKMPKIKWNKLTEVEKNIVRIFNHILFDQEYAKDYVSKTINDDESWGKFYISAFEYCGYEFDQKNE